MIKTKVGHDKIFLLLEYARKLNFPIYVMNWCNNVEDEFILHTSYRDGELKLIVDNSFGLRMKDLLLCEELNYSNFRKHLKGIAIPF